MEHRVDQVLGEALLVLTRSPHDLDVSGPLEMEGSEGKSAGRICKKEHWPIW